MQRLLLGRAAAAAAPWVSSVGGCALWTNAAARAANAVTPPPPAAAAAAWHSCVGGRALWTTAGAAAAGDTLASAAAAAATTVTEEVVDCVVVGAGVIGLACARAIACRGLQTIVLESEPDFGSITSSRHSEVIHAGIYYPQYSLKARLCVEGKERLYDYCQEHEIPHKRIGKLIVATSEGQIPKLKQLQQSAAANGVTDLQLLTGDEARELEPQLSAAAALLSPSTGIIDSHAFMESLADDIWASEYGLLSTHSKLLAVKQVPGNFTMPEPPSSSSSSSSKSKSRRRKPLSTTAKPLLQLLIQDTGSGAMTILTTRWLVNAAGLSAQAVAQTITPTPKAIPKQYLAKGNYFSLGYKPPFSRLIYPIPEDGGLGVHLTLDLAGQARFGPDVEWVEDDKDYSVDPTRAEVFYPAIRSYYPALPDGALQPSYSGIRPKLSGPGEPAADFVIQGPKDHGVKGLVNLYGIESPGLTSSLAIGHAVAEMLPGLKNIL